MPRARTLIALAVAAFSLAPAFADDKPVAQPAAPAAPEAKAVTSPIKLLEQGEAPRKPLRLSLKAGEKQQAVMRMEMKLDATMEGRAMPAQPAIKTRMGIESEVVGVSENGATLRVRYPFIEAEDPTAPYAAMLKSRLVGMDKCKVDMVISPRGEVISSTLDIPEGLDPLIAQQMEQMNQSIGQMILVFPEQPVGKLARWTLTRSVKTSGLNLDTVMTIEVAEIDGNKVSLKLTSVGKAVDQPLVGPGIPAGAATVELMDVAGTGSQTMRLDRAIPSAAQSTSDANIAMKFTQGDASQKMNQKMAMKMEIREPRDGEFKPAEPAKQEEAKPVPASK